MAERMEEKDMRRLIEKLPPSDPIMEETLFMDVIEHSFTIYDAKKNRAVCTRCGEEWEIAPGEYARMHGLEGICPCCCSRNIYASAGRGRACYEEYIRLLHFTEHEGTLYGFLDYITVSFKPFGRPSLLRSLEEVYIFNKDKQERWAKQYQYYSGYCYEKRRRTNVPPAPTAPYTWESKWRNILWSKDLLDTIARSDCRYIFGTGLLSENEGMMLPAYIGTMMKYHSVELLAKAGFSNIARHKIDGGTCRGINWRANSLQKILKLPKRDVKRLRQWDPTCDELEAFQQLPEECRRDIDMMILRDMLSWRTYDYEKKKYEYSYKKEIEKYMPFDKWLRWAKTQEHYSEKKRPCLLRDYEDYIGTAEKLGMDIHKKSVLRPKDLKQAHDEAVNRLKIERDNLIDAAIAENARADEFSFRGLMVIPAKCQEDLNKESAVLGHCVKTYGGKLARGACYIYFVRDAKAPDTPFYTMETKPNGELVQCRGKHNCSMTDEVELFTDAFIKMLRAEIKKEAAKCQTA